MQSRGAIGAKPWSTSQIQTLLRMAGSGSTAREIASALYKSKSSIIGYCNRHGVYFKHEKVFTRNRTRQKSFVKIIYDTPKITKPDQENKPTQTIPTKQRYGSPSHCQYLHGEPRERSFCQSASTHGSYCEDHYRLCVLHKPQQQVI